MHEQVARLSTRYGAIHSQEQTRHKKTFVTACSFEKNYCIQKAPCIIENYPYLNKIGKEFLLFGKEFLLFDLSLFNSFGYNF